MIIIAIFLDFVKCVSSFLDNNVLVFKYPCSDNSCHSIPLFLNSGQYLFECWGAQGGNGSNSLGLGGKGGYTSGILKIQKSVLLYLFIGNSGLPAGEATFNGGARGYPQTQGDGGSGGGSTDIRLIDGSWNDFNGLKSRIMVAGGGGGGSGYFLGYSGGPGGAGGGLIGHTGNSGNYTSPTYLIHSGGGGQTYGGTKGLTYSGSGFFDGIDGSFGIGGASLNSIYSPGGGGGYYGGGGPAISPHRVGTGGGGSSFISGYTGCNAIAPESTSLNIVHTNQPIHYSNITFINPVILSGEDLMPSPDSDHTLGHNGSGAIRVTLLECSCPNICTPHNNPTFPLSHIIMLFFCSTVIN